MSYSGQQRTSRAQQHRLVLGEKEDFSGVEMKLF